MIVKKFEIPTGRPIPDAEQGFFGPSAELVEFNPKPLLEEHLIGLRVDEIITYAGTYGMGGPGFFGIRLGEEWLIISIWGASDWLNVDGRPVTDNHYRRHSRPAPWISESGDELSPTLLGRMVVSVVIGRTSMKIEFDGGMSLKLEEDCNARPALEGTGQPRAFQANDDLRDAVFLSPTMEIWV